ncbi:MAG: hypothetical protein V8T36_09815 [Ruthenibacterium lactatiformans]
MLVVKVHALQKNYKMPARVLEDPDFFKKRYRQIRHFEEYLYENGCRVVKIFLNLSREKQKERSWSASRWRRRTGNFPRRISGNGPTGTIIWTPTRRP